MLTTKLQAKHLTTKPNIQVGSKDHTTETYTWQRLQYVSVFCAISSFAISYHSLRKIPQFHLISWCGYFAERHSFHIVSGELRKSRKSGEITVFFPLIIEYMFYHSFPHCYNGYVKYLLLSATACASRGRLTQHINFCKFSAGNYFSMMISHFEQFAGH